MTEKQLSGEGRVATGLAWALLFAAGIYVAVILVVALAAGWFW